jgi:hypothetical protein
VNDPRDYRTHGGNRYLERPALSSLADVIDTILDKGLVIDVYVRVSLVGSNYSPWTHGLWWPASTRT